MRAARLYKSLDIRIDDIKVPPVMEDEVLVRVKSVGICRSDIHYYHDGRIGDVVITEPLVLGHEFAGEIVEVGKLVEKVKPGDRVAVDPALSCGACEMCQNDNPNLCPTVKFCGTPPINGALSEFFVANEKQLFKIPFNMTYDEGAMLEPLGVAIHSINLSKIKEWQSAAIIGCGSIGLLTLQLLKMLETRMILAIDLLPNRLELASSFGADYTLLNHSKSIDIQGFNGIHESGFDVVFEVAGDDHTPEQAIEICKPGGKIILIGINPNNEIKINSGIFRRKGLTLLSVRRMKHTYPEAISLKLSGKVNFNPLMTHNYDLEHAAEAFNLADNYLEGAVKVFINP
jgi:L-iditol 2-dehydrogenase